MSSTVYIASFSRGRTRPKIQDAISLNVTTCQGKNHPDRLAFSPMHVGPVIDRADCLCFQTFEGWWQGQKRYRELGHISDDNLTSTPKYQSFREMVAKIPVGQSSKLRHPKGTKTKNIIGYQTIHGKTVNKYQRLRPVDAIYHGQLVNDYISSRKIAYVTCYSELIKDNNRIQYYRQLLDKGNNIVVYDLDGPKDHLGHNIVCPVTTELLKNKINDTSYSFGHGYVVAATLLNIPTSDYCS